MGNETFKLLKSIISCPSGYIYTVVYVYSLSFLLLKTEEVFKRLPGFKKIFVLEFRYIFNVNLHDYIKHTDKRSRKMEYMLISLYCSFFLIKYPRPQKDIEG